MFRYIRFAQTHPRTQPLRAKLVCTKPIAPPHNEILELLKTIKEQNETLITQNHRFFEILSNEFHFSKIDYEGRKYLREFYKKNNIDLCVDDSYGYNPRTTGYRNDGWNSPY